MASENLIFISYASEDKDFAVKLAHDLLLQDANIWLADFEIKAGDSWDMEVQKALTACISFLVVLSEASEKSKNVMDEVAYAIEEKKVIIPILFQKCNIHFRLRRLQHVDFTVDYDQGFQDLIESVRVPQETIHQSTKEIDEKDEKKEREDRIKLAEVEAKRKVEEQRKLAEAEAKRKAEEQRKLAEAEAKRKAEEQRKLAETEAKRKAEEQRKLAEAEAKRKAEEQRKQTETEAKRKAEEEKKKLQKGYWQRGQGVLSAAVIIGLAIFITYFVSKSISPDTNTTTNEPKEEQTPTNPDITPGEFPGMVSIPAGTFMMGSENGEDDEKPLHEVTIDAFYMDNTEVTVAQYDKFVKATGHDKPDKWTAQLQQPKHPVVYISWNDATAYAKWASKRLPTEAEWEYAARGGLEGKKYPWGDEIETSKANYGNPYSSNWSEGPGKYLKNAGSYSSNNYGLYDMAGNVGEWCSDWLAGDYYENSPTKNPKGPGTGEQRVLRGGSWNFDPLIIRCANRYGSNPTFRLNSRGFRCVQDVR